MNKKLILASATALAVSLGVASVAYACTTVRGQTEITQTDSGSGATTRTQCATDAVPPPGECTSNVANALGRTIKAKSAGHADLANKTFYMHFLNKLVDQDGMNICMSKAGATHSDKRISAAVVASGTGVIAETTGNLPVNMHPGGSPNDDHLPHNGTAAVCFLTAGNGFGTNDATLLIVGGTA